MELTGWQFKASDEDEWHDSCDTAKATCEIFPDLMALGTIPDPFKDMNELEVQWVGEKDWEYRCRFAATGSHAHRRLVFQGLDTFCDVYLNGELLLSTENMFRQYEADVSDRLQAANELRLYFHSALLRGRWMWQNYGRTGCSNGEGSRCWVRKAQYHYGWDWGPMLMTCGVWRPVVLEQWDERLDATVEAVAGPEPRLEVRGTARGHRVMGKISHVWRGHGLATVSHSKFFELDTDFAHTFTRSDFPFEPWWPHGLGDQNLYAVELVLLDSQLRVLDKQTHRFAFREIELVQDEYADEAGSSFYFRVNGVPTFANGSNWIPAHSFLTQIADDDYRAWLQLARDSHQNIVRVWGGGVYEPELFYDECDKHGIMIWQDFMFACGQYPGKAEFVENVRSEVAFQVRRLSKHPCLALFCGNNEDYQYAESHHLQWDKNDDSGDYFHTTFPGRGIYEVVIPEELEKAGCKVAYHRGSPYGGSYTHDPTVGDTHMWQIWHGRKEEYQRADTLSARFISEFGMECFPNLLTLQENIASSGLYPQSQLIEFHNKAKDSLPSLTKYMYSNVKVFDSLDGFVYSNQIMQSECLTFALNLWRLRWKQVEAKSGGVAYQNGGSIVWQMDDCWPVISWAVVDHLRRPKLAYYAIKRCFEKLIIVTKRNGKQGWEHFASDAEDTADVEVWVSSTAPDTETDLELTSSVYRISTGELLSTETLAVSAPANDTTKLPTVKLDHQKDKVVFFKLQGGSFETSTVDWPQPLKYIQYRSKPDITVAPQDGLISLTSTHPVKCVELFCGDPKDVKFSDNGFDLVPGHTKHVKMEHSGAISYRFYLHPQWLS